MTRNPKTTINGRFSVVAGRYHDHVAVVDSSGSCTYGELADLSDRVCHRLQQSGARSGSIVALIFEPGIDATAAVLGVLKAGCSFVPLDIDDPDARLGCIMDDCEPSFVIVDKNWISSGRRLDVPAARVIAFDAIRSVPPGTVTHAEVPGDTLAYTFYTSGSTGQPKGVCQPHCNFLYFADAYREALRIGERDRLSNLFSFSFSAGNLDVFGGLLSGASVHCFNARKQGLGALRAWLVGENISVMHISPSVFRQLMKTTPAGFQYEHLRVVDLAGEAVYSNDLHLLRSHLRPGCTCFIHYAATEANVICLHRIDFGHDYTGSRLPVGRPPAGVEVMIEGKNGLPAEVDEVGPIVIRSPFVTTGYWRRPELNSRCFRMGDDGIREYRGGDYGFRDSIGDIVHLGRSDNRVKLRGFSVDPGEIESALNDHDDVENAVVITRAAAEETGNATLVAHIQCKPGALTQESTRAFLATRVPSYMLPGHIVFTDKFPLTDTGKIDRAALPEPPVRTRRLDREMVAPADETQKELAAMMAATLEIDVVGVDDSFFDLGADSLMTAGLLEDVKSRYEVEIPLATFVSDPTVRGLARSLTGGPTAAVESGTPLVPVRSRGDKRPFFLVPGGVGDANTLGLAYSGVARHLGPDQPFYGLVAKGVTGFEECPDVESLAREFVDAVRTVQPDDPYRLGGFCIGGILAFEMARQLTEAGARVQTLILINTEVPTEEIRGTVQRRRVVRSLRRLRRRTRYVLRRVRHHLGRLSTLKGKGHVAYLARCATGVAATGRDISYYNRRMETRLQQLMASYCVREYPGRVDFIMTRPAKWSQEVNWSKHVKGGVKTHVARGRIDDPLVANAPDIGETIRACLDDGSQDSG